MKTLLKKALITGITGQDGSYLAELVDADVAMLKDARRGTGRARL